MEDAKPRFYHCAFHLCTSGYTSMPTYEYVCKTCGENFDVHQSFSDKPLKKHDVCGGDLQKVFHARGIVFKGGGFYATDSKAPAKSEKTSSKTDSKKDSKKTESKPESKPKTKEKAKSTQSGSDAS